MQKLLLFFVFLLCNDVCMRGTFIMKKQILKTITCYTLIIIGVTLISWAVIGQQVAQMSQFGAYYSFKTIYDVSLYGHIGAIPLVTGILLLTLRK